MRLPSSAPALPPCRPRSRKPPGAALLHALGLPVHMGMDTTHSLLPGVPLLDLAFLTHMAVRGRTCGGGGTSACEQPGACPWRHRSQCKKF